MNTDRLGAFDGGVYHPPTLPPTGGLFVEPSDVPEDEIGLRCCDEPRGRPVPFTLVHRLLCDVPAGPHEVAARLRLRLESPACALAQDAEAAVSELRCPACGALGAWEDEATNIELCSAPDDAVDHEPYAGRRRASCGVWRCRKGHETREPIRPRHEPRGARSGQRSRKPPTAGRNAREDGLVGLYDLERRLG